LNNKEGKDEVVETSEKKQDSPERKPAFASAQNVSPGSMDSIFANERYVEREMDAKEIVNVEIPFDREKYGENVVLKWEYICHSEQTPLFGISYIPESLEMSPVAKLLPFLSSGRRVLFPISNVQSYTKPAYGVIPISQIPSGKFVLTWDNTQVFTKRQSKSFAYKAQLENSAELYSCHCQIDIIRKSAITLPVIKTDTPGQINVEYSAGLSSIPFAMYLDIPNFPIKAAASGPSIRSEIVGLIPRKTLIPFNKIYPKNAGSSIKEIEQINDEGPCVLSLIWDNTQSLMSTKHVDIHLEITRKLIE
jgi:hypothetical protein